jgi:hypothetical protein
LDGLWVETQPREIVPEEQLQRLIAEGRAQPATLLEALDWAAAADPYYAEVMAELRGLATSIASEGVLEPIKILVRDHRMIVHDGHRRTLASLLAGKTAIPALEITEPTELTAVAHAFIVNLQRQDLTPVEKGGALLRLALLVGRRLLDEQGEDPALVTIEALVGDDVPEAMVESAWADSTPGLPESAQADSMGDPMNGRTVTGLSRQLAAQIRDRVCAMTGLRRERYYSYLALNRLTPAARAQARGLSEKRLRPIARLTSDQQVRVLTFAQQEQLSDDAVATLARAVRTDPDEVTRVMARLAAERTRQGGAAPAWKALLFGVPADWQHRLAALTSELAGLPEAQRQKRLAEVARAAVRHRALGDSLASLAANYAVTLPTEPEESEPGL